MIDQSLDIPRSEWEHLIDEWIFDEIDRKILTMVLLDGKTMERTADILGYSTLTIKRRFKKARERLFKKI